MTAHILVTYTTRTESTAEIAAAIGKELQVKGYLVDIADMKEITSIEKYDAIVLGAPVYMGHIEKKLLSFITRNREMFAKIPFAVFIVGIAPVSPQAGAVDTVLDQLRKAASPLKPVALTMFAGRLERKTQSFLKRTMIDIMKVPTGDFRNWDDISEWAQGLPVLLEL